MTIKQCSTCKHLNEYSITTCKGCKKNITEKFDIEDRLLYECSWNIRTLKYLEKHLTLPWGLE